MGYVGGGCCGKERGSVRGREIHWFQWGALEVPSVMEGTCSPCEIFFLVKHKLMGVEQIKYVEPNRRD